MTWGNAKNTCGTVSEGAHLVFITSDQENNEVSRLVKEIHGEQDDWWIGLTKDGEATGTWKWYNMSVTYTNWAPNEPNNLNGNQNCGELWKWQCDIASWNDKECTMQRSFICEKEK
ncbi:C-type lectin lectoxin-Thr1 [Holothuria leucospilota]|uniref:C-type lectin lectoxin-Thr1 n=1 Tax=Holothuria leucospilota TaxID=206669 RepID=A0A9Q1BSG3_HOLLE|nr:C-type lectin lectoxin-Thr1 [Holothuria leucospilota]